MRKAILLSLVLICLKSFAQDWAPLKESDTLKHYLSQDWLNQNSTYTYRPIQSISIKNSTTNSTGVAKTMDKSFSVKKMTNTFLEDDIIKARILGDSVQFYADSTSFFSRDSLGFKLTFPKKYSVGDTFKFAQSIDHLIFGVCDSLFQDTLNNGIVDSLAKVSLRVTDRSLLNEPSHPFNTFIEISKSYGLIKTPDFESINDSLQQFELFFGLANKIKCENTFDLSIGDEFHQVEVLNNYNNILNKEVWYTTALTGDTVNGSSHTYTFNEYSREYMPSLGSIQHRTYQTTIDTAIYCHFPKSAIIADSLLQNSMRNNSQPIYIYGISKVSTHPLVKTSMRSNDIIDYNSNVTWPPTIDSLLSGQAMYQSYSFDYLGLGNSYFQNGFGGNGLSSISKEMVYVKKGNQTWGTPLNLSVGIDEENLASNSFKPYPNPVNNLLYIKNIEQLDFILLYDKSGRLIREINHPQTEINVSDLSNGIYFLKLQTKTGNQSNQMFIKH